MEFRVNDKVEYNTNNKIHDWCIYQTVEVNDNQIKIKPYDSDQTSEAIWINKTSHNLSYINTHKFIQLPLPNIKNYVSGCCKAIYYVDNNKEYILLCTFYNTSILRYDIANNEWEQFSNFFREQLPCNDKQICFNAARKELYIFYEYTLGIFQLDKKRWIIRPITDNHRYLFHESGAVQICFVPFPMEEIHLFKGNGHFQINEYDELIKLNQNKLLKPDDIIWWETEQKLIKYVAIQQKIMYANISLTLLLQKLVNWQICSSLEDLGIDENKHCQMILVFENILLLFQSQTRNAWCIDMVSPIYMRNKIKRKLPYFDSITLVNDRYLHFIAPQYCHIRLPVWEFIPKQSIFRVNLCNPLVYGFVARTVDTYDSSISLPIDVIQIIFKFVFVALDKF